MLGPSTLVGRASERARVLELLDRQSGVVVFGEAGVGKTALARTAITELTGTAIVHDAVATQSARAIPFGALAAWLPPAPEGDPAADRRPAAAQLLARWTKDARANGVPPVLFIDDAHLLDQASAAVVLDAARTGVATIALTVRSGEPVPDAITAFWKDGFGERIDIEALNEADHRDLVHSLLDAPVEAGTVESIWKATEGNPLFVRELVASAIRNGTLQQYEQVWTMRGDIRVDQRLTDIVTATVGAIDPQTRNVTELVAAGERVPLVVLEHLTSPDDVARAETAGVIVTEVERGWVSMSHPLFGDVVRAQLPASRIRHLRAELASSRPDGQRGDVDLVDEPLTRAMWIIDGGGDVDERLFVRAAAQAYAAARYDLTIRLGACVLRAGAHPGAALITAKAHNALHDGEAAAAVLDGYEKLDLPGELQCRIAGERHNALLWVLGDRDRALTSLRDWKAVTHEQPWHDLLALSEALLEGDGEKGHALAAQLVGPENDARTRVHAFGDLGYEWCYAGETDQAIATAAELMFPAMRQPSYLGDTMTMIVVPYVLALIQQGHVGRVEQLVELFRSAYDVKSDLIDAMALGLLGATALIRGKPRTARALLEESVAVQQASGQSWRVANSWTALADARALGGDAGAAQSALHQAHATMREVEGPAAAALKRTEVWCTYAAEGRDAARPMAEALLTKIDDRHRAVRLLALFDLLRLGAHDAAPRILEVGPVDGPWAAAIVSMARGLRQRDATVLDDAATAMANLGLVLHAAEAAALAADAHRRAGDLAAAARADRRSKDWEAECEGARSPILELRQPAASTSLTARERQIVGMAARGRSNRDIAEELVVSMRTVEGHLSRAYAKLGVSNREQLVALLDTRPNRD